MARVFGAIHVASYDIGYGRESLGYSDHGSLGGTLLTALPYIDARLPYVSRSGTFSKATDDWAYRGGMTYGDNKAAAGVLQKVLYRQDLFNEVVKILKADVPQAAVHVAVNSPISNPLNEDHVTWLERRYHAARHRGIVARIAERYVCLTEYSAPQMERWLANKVNVPLGGMLVENSRTQMMQSQIALAGAGPVGVFKMSGFDNIVSFDAASQHFTVQTTVSGAPIIDDPRRFFFAMNTRGSTFLGGNGNRYVNDMPDGRIAPLWLGDGRLADADLRQYTERIHENFYNGEAQGNYSKIAVLMGYNTAVHPDEVPRNFALDGNWNPADFAGTATHLREFVAVRDAEMYPGQYAVSAVFDFYKYRPQFNLESLSYLQRREMNQRNNIIHRDTTLVFDPHVGEEKTAAFDLWGDKFPGAAAQFASLSRLPESALALDVY